MSGPFDNGKTVPDKILTTKYFIPRKSGVHRFACLCLYKALLAHCTRLNLSRPHKDGLQSFIRAQFKAHATLQSPSKITSALKAGYEAVDLLHAASTGNAQSLANLSRLLKSTAALKSTLTVHARLSQKPTSPPTPTQLAVAASVAAHKNPVAHTPRLDVLSRPLPASALTGRRHVPVLVSAAGLPFLRLTKPQPPSLSRMIRQKLEARQKIWDGVEFLKKLNPLAEDEDEWDEIVTEMDGRLKDPTGATFIEAQRETYRSWWQKSREMEAKGPEMARRMQEIVEEEGRLKREEDEEWRRVKRGEARRRRSARRRSGGDESIAKDTEVLDSETLS
jgi:hypothetical protein